MTSHLIRFPRWAAFVVAAVALAMALPVFAQMPVVAAQAAKATEEKGKPEPADKSATAQAPEAEEAPPPVTPIAEQDIPARAESLLSHLRVWRSRLAATGEVPRIAQEFIGFEKEILAEASELAEQTQSELPLRVLEERADLWARNAAVLERWSAPVSRRAEELLRIQSDLATNREKWEATAGSLASKEVLPALSDRIAASLQAIAEVEAPLKEQLESVLTLQNLLSTYTAEIEEIRAELASSIREATRKLIRVEMPPLWELTWTNIGPAPALAEVLAARLREAATYAYEQRVPLMFHGAALVALFIGLMVLRRKPIDPAAPDPGLRVASHILSRPFSTALAIGLLPLGFLYPYAPSMFIEICLLLTLFPFLRLLPGMISVEVRRPVLALALLFILFRLERLALGVSLTYRFLLLGVSIASWVTILVWRRSQKKLPGIGRIPRAFSLVSLVLMSVAVVANIVGAVSLASLLGGGTIAALYMVTVLFAAGQALDAVLAAAGQSDAGRSLVFLRRHEGAVSLWRERAIHYLLLAIWIRATLTIFRLWEPVRAGTVTALEHEWSVGSLGFTLGGILTFCLVIVVAVVFARLTRFVVEEDVLPHMDLPRGVPGTISMLISYAIIGIGILTAFSAAGLELSRITLIAGALSLGIGFGLQGLVNNFVSGLILIFERPFSIGDTVEFGKVIGEVRSIGIRSCIVRTPDGAEVIVPNGSLLSGEVINWTLSDRQRRIEVKVGVAYGSDPARIIELLVTAAKPLKGVSEYPQPRAVFVGFGESSLDFLVRAWTTGEVEWPEVMSNLGVAVNRALNDAGIEIPFPQRDVRLRGGQSQIGSKE